MTLQQLYSYTRRAINDYQMITANDKVAVGISGGKDSLALLYALAGLRKFYPEQFDIVAITVDLGFPEMDWKPVQELCEQLQVEYHIVPTKIAQILFEKHMEVSPCSLCAKMRKGALNEFAKACGCNKVAYGHHMDDIIETMFLSLIYEGRFSSFSPVTFLERTGLTVIRPLMYVPEVNITGFKNKYELPVIVNTCPVDGYTKRQYVKNLVRNINLENPGAKKRLFHAITNANLEGWLKNG